MPKFMLNDNAAASHPYYSLNTFAKGYVEAMFFTNGDTGDEREHLLNDWGVERLTRAAVARIKERCAEFEKRAADLLREAYERVVHEHVSGGFSLSHAAYDYDEACAGRDFWFTSQGHGVGFWDRTALEADDLGRRLSDVAEEFGELYVDAYRGWIHVR
jgi:hypothetical protein